MVTESPNTNNPPETITDFFQLQTDIESYYNRCHLAYEKLLTENRDLESQGKGWEEGRSEKEQALNASTNDLFQLLAEMRRHRDVFEGMKDIRKRYQAAVGLVVNANAI